jgi:hypothetical protein
MNGQSLGYWVPAAVARCYRLPELLRNGESFSHRLTASQLNAPSEPPDKEQYDRSKSCYGN